MEYIDDALNNRGYKFVDIIGSGGNGIVFKMIKDNQLYAVKRSDKSQFLFNDMLHIYLENEIQAMKYSQNNHHIVQFYENFEDMRYHYIVMEYCDGGNILDYIKRQGLMQTGFVEDEACKIAFQILKGLYGIHQAGYAHRDLKLEAVLIKDGIFKIGGLSIVQPISQEMSTFIGTLDYMAPEIKQSGEKQDHRVDIWYLGVLLFKLLFIESPFIGTSFDNISLDISQKTKGKKFDITKHNFLNIKMNVKAQTCSPQLVDFLAQTIAYEPDHRLTFDQMYKHPLFQKINTEQFFFKQVDDFYMGEDCKFQKSIIKIEQNTNDNLNEQTKSLPLKMEDQLQQKSDMIQLLQEQLKNLNQKLEISKNESVLLNKKLEDMEASNNNLENQILTLRNENISLKDANKSQLAQELRTRIALIDDNQLENKVLIGKGAFGNVFKCFYNGTPYVAKHFDIDDQFSPQNLGASFLQELINQSKVLSDHRNFNSLVACGLDARKKHQGETISSAFLLFKYINGGTLQQEIENKEKKQPLYPFIYGKKDSKLWKTRLQFCQAIVEGIEFLHQYNLYHCDLSNNNIMVERGQDNSVYPIIIDIGISKLAQINNKTVVQTNIQGISHYWMPYEYVHEGEISPKTDVWSLGCIIFYVMTGCMPWSEIKNYNGVSSKLDQKADFFNFVKPEALSNLGPLREILNDCLKHEKQDRPFVVELKQRIKQLLEQK